MARNKFDVDETLEKPFDKNQFIRIIRYIKPYKNKMLLALLIMVVSTLLSLFGPLILSQAIDEGMMNKDFKYLILMAIAFIAVTIGSSLCNSSRIAIMTRIGQNVIRDLRHDIFVHLQKLPFSYYDSRPHGKILSRVVNYVNSISDLLTNGVIQLIVDFLSLIFILGFMIFINPRLTLISLVGLPILVIVIFAMKKAQRRANQALSNKSSNLNAYLHESFTGIKTTQAFAREKKNIGIFSRLSEEFRRAWMRAVRINNALGPIVENVSNISVCAVYVIGISYLSGEIAVGEIIAFSSYISRFWAPISNIANFYNSMINAVAYLERIFETIDEPVVVNDVPNAIELPEVKGNITFENVTFSYDSSVNIIKNLSFKVNAGETIALVGATGAGKTTIVNLISRFYNVNEGRILIDGIDISKVTLKSLRKQMGIMLQDSFIFSGTILDNIKYGKLDATYEEVVEASKAVNAHSFIVNMEDGYDTQVNERGSRLSVGQRQLISFARTLLSDPKILILDEATSSIDTKTEKIVQRGLEALLKGRTSFVIAHRLSTIKNADKIMVIGNKGIIESGNHDELMYLKGDYYDLYTSQYKDVGYIAEASNGGN